MEKDEQASSPASRRSDASSGDDCEWLVQLIAQNQSVLHRFIMTLLPHASDADEVLQETILVLWRKRDSFDRGSNFLAWARVIARYEVFRFLRSANRSKIGLSEAAITKLADLAESRVLSNEKQSERKEALNGCIEKLGTEEREVIQQRYFLNVAVDHIAQRLGKAQSTVYAVLTRARGQLAECVRRQLESI